MTTEMDIPLRIDHLEDSLGLIASPHSEKLRLSHGYFVFVLGYTAQGRLGHFHRLNPPIFLSPPFSGPLIQLRIYGGRNDFKDLDGGLPQLVAQRQAERVQGRLGRAVHRHNGKRDKA
jgi:hypothetical protein